MTENEITQMQADNVYMSELLQKTATQLLSIGKFVDEGDRVYFNSTNDADVVNDLIRDLDEWQMDQIMEAGEQPRNLYAEMRDLHRMVATLADEINVEHDIELLKEANATFGNYTGQLPHVPEISLSGKHRLAWWAGMLADMAQTIKREAAEMNQSGMANEAMLLCRLQLSVEETGEWAEALSLGDIVKAAAELTDMNYVTAGHYLTLGIGPWKRALMTETHRASMSKLGEDGKPIISDAGRWVKGPNFKPADIAAVLRRDPNEPV